MKRLLVPNYIVLAVLVVLIFVGLNDANVKMDRYGSTYEQTVIIDGESHTRTVSYYENFGSVLFLFLIFAVLLLDTVELSRTTTPIYKL